MVSTRSQIKSKNNKNDDNQKQDNLNQDEPKNDDKKKQDNLNEDEPKKENKKTQKNKNNQHPNFSGQRLPRSGNSGLIPLTMPINFMFYGISKRTKEEDEYDDEHDDDHDDEHDDEHDDDHDDDDDYDSDFEEMFDFSKRIKDIRQKIVELNISSESKDKLQSMLKSSNLDEKRMEWFDTLMKIPFGNYSKYEIDINDNIKTQEYIKNVYSNLEESVWGMKEVKEEVLNYVAQCIIQPDSKPRVLALCGQPGIGKTKIVRDGISKSLNREMRCFSMGGIKDSSTFFGFDYTYVGSRHGTIVQSLIDTKTMNPILFFDELDKISDTKDGQDIENFLIHLTDPIQNYDFNDKYFTGFPIDVSKSLLIFSFNDLESISPILRDRLHIINIPSPSIKDKINISKKFFVKEFLENFKLDTNEVIFHDEILKYIIERYTNDENGVRGLKRCIETICMKINTSKLLGKSIKELNLSTSKLNIILPITLTKEHIDTLLYIKDYKNEKIPFMYT